MEASRLPIKVELDSDAGYYASNSKTDVFRLAERIKNLNEAELRQFMPPLFAMGVMYPSLWFQQVLRLIKWRRRVDDLGAWRLLLSQPRASKVLLNIQRATVEHIMSGKDREERNSVGGWSQREINFASNLLAVLDRHKVAA